MYVCMCVIDAPAQPPDRRDYECLGATPIASDIRGHVNIRKYIYICVCMYVCYRCAS